MPALNMWIALLTHRLSHPRNIPAADGNVWDSFPFNNPTFCERFGLRDTIVGLSVPPVGPIGEQLTQAIRDEWPRRAAAGEQFLRWLDDDSRSRFDELRKEKAQVKAAKKGKKDKKGKGKQRDSDEEMPVRDDFDANAFALDKLQVTWKRSASPNDFDSWHWLLNHTFGITGGLYQQLREAMQQFHCDAETAHRIERDKMARSNDFIDN